MLLKFPSGPTGPSRTPAARSATTARSRLRSPGCRRPRRPAAVLTSAEPTITASANSVTSRAWAPFETPSPTPTSASGSAARTRATSSGAAEEVWARAPVTPITEVA